MRGLLAAETLKVVKRRVYWIMLAILAAIMGLSAVIFLVVLPDAVPEGMPGLPVSTKPEAYVFGASQVLGQTWFPAILAVVLLGGEMSTTVWASALTRESRRWRHLLAKVVVVTAASWLAALAALALWSVVTAVVADGAGAPGVAEWAGIVVKLLLVQLTWVALGLGATALLRAMGPALGAVLGFSFLEGVLALWEPWREVTLSGASGRLIEQASAVQGGVGVGAIVDMPFGQAVAVVAGWAVVGVGLAVLGLGVRDP